MKRNLRGFLVFIALSALPSHAVVSYIALRSQSNNMARVLCERRIASGSLCDACAVDKSVSDDVCTSESINTAVDVANTEVTMQSDNDNAYEWCLSLDSLPNDCTTVISFDEQSEKPCAAPPSVKPILEPAAPDPLQPPAQMREKRQTELEHMLITQPVFETESAQPATFSETEQNKYYTSQWREIGITGMYQKSWNNTQLNRCFFGADLIGDQIILIQGSHFNNGTRNRQAWLADYFGLPTDFSGSISYQPLVKNGIVELGGWYSFDNALFVDFQIPLVHTSARLNACEMVTTSGELGYVNGYFSEDAIDAADLLSHPREFFEAELTPNLGSSTIFNPLRVSKFLFQGTSCHLSHQTRLSDVILRIGYDARIKEESCLKLYARFSVPAGNKPEGIFLLEPVVGNGGHWGLGAGAAAERCLWNSCCCDQAIYFYADAYVQHLFSAKQKRSFDLKRKPNSRYMLAQKLGTTRQSPALSGPSDAGVEFQNEFSPIANLTYGNVSVSAAAEGEILARFILFLNSWQCTLGYNFWTRSGEKICYTSTPCGLRDTLWALKGDAQVIGFRSTDNAAVRLAAVQNATLHRGTNHFPTGIDGLDPIQNPGVVNRVTATTGAGVPVVAVPFLPETVNTSNPAPTITLCDIDLRGTSGLSNTLFATLSYTPVDKTYGGTTPLIELGAQVEFGSSSQQCASSTWGIWGTLGVGF